MKMLWKYKSLDMSHLLKEHVTKAVGFSDLMFKITSDFNETMVEYFENGAFMI